MLTARNSSRMLLYNRMHFLCLESYATSVRSGCIKMRDELLLR